MRVKNKPSSVPDSWPSSHGPKELGENLVAGQRIFFYSAKLVDPRQLIPEEKRGGL